MDFSKITVVTGHYGSGKTNFAVNLALDIAKSGKKCTVVDLDIVNPYFRTADFSDLFEKNNITLKIPVYANTNLDIPSLDFDLNTIIKGDEYIILDVGGDDAGAIALGGYSDTINSQSSLEMLYVINYYRYLTREPLETLELMYEIEAASKMKCTGIVNNSNLGTETTDEVMAKSLPYAAEIAEKAGLPIKYTVGRKDVLPKDAPNPYPVDVYVKTLWS